MSDSDRLIWGEILWWYRSGVAPARMTTKPVHDLCPCGQVIRNRSFLPVSLLGGKKGQGQLKGITWIGLTKKKAEEIEELNIS